MYLMLCFFPVWLATQNHSTLVTDTTVVPFLPVNPEYSSTRNQASDFTRVTPCFKLSFVVGMLDLTVPSHFVLFVF